MNDKNTDHLPSEDEPDTNAPADDTTRELPHTAEAREQPVATATRRPWWKTPAALIAAVAVALVLLVVGTAAITTQVTLASANNQHSSIRGPGGAGAGPGGFSKHAPTEPGAGSRRGPDDSKAPGRGPDGNGRGAKDGSHPTPGTAPTAAPTAPAAP